MAATETETPSQTEEIGVFGRIGQAIRNEYAPLLAQAAIDKAELGTIKAQLDTLTAANATLTLSATDYTTEIAKLNANVGTLTAEKAAVEGTVATLTAIVPGIASANGDKAAITAAVDLVITQRTADQIATMGMPAGTAPGTEEEPDGRSLDEQFADCKTQEDKAAFLKAHGAEVFKK